MKCADEITYTLWQGALLESLIDDDNERLRVRNALAQSMQRRQEFIAEHGQEAWDALPENAAHRERVSAHEGLTRFTEFVTEAAFACIKRWPESVTSLALDYLIEVAEMYHDHECDP